MKAPTREQLNDPSWWDENAPEGATHAKFGDRITWLRYEYGIWRFWQGSCWSRPSVRPAGDLFARPTRPSAPDWDGEGPPPVGCECERLIGNDVYRVVVVAHFNDEVVVYQEDAAPEYTGVQSGYLRPRRTHEQRVKELVTGLAASAINSRLSIEDRKQSALMLALEELYDAGLLREAGA